MEAHGEPAVCATTSADEAIFRALKNFPDNIGPAGTSFGNGEYSASQNVIALAKRKTAKVYVLDKSRFRPLEAGGSEFRCSARVIPLDVVDVSFEDMPENIQIRDGDDF